MLCRVTIWFTVALAVWCQEKSDKEFEEKCENVPANCCNDTMTDDNTNIIYQEKIDKAISECPLSKEKSFCELALCVGTKVGYLSADGKIIKEKMIEFIDAEFNNFSAELNSAIKDKCITSDVTMYGKKDECEISLFTNCLDVQWIKNCRIWNNEGPCLGAKDAAAECYKLFD